jgi:Ca-activated chloride channel family protein
MGEWIEALRDFHFAQPWWLLGLVVPLVLLWLPPSRRAHGRDLARLARYADPHLLPHLLRATPDGERPPRRLGLWSALWLLGVLAMAGPRWDYTDLRVERPGDSLLVLFDLSASMRAADVKPNRLARARQEVEDLLDRAGGLRVGLVAFASVAHAVAPITEDYQTIRHLLPSLSPDLVRWQGSRPAAALERAERLLAGQAPGTRHAVVLLTDGDFVEEGLEARAAGLRAKGVAVHVLGIGSVEGAPVPGSTGAAITGQDGRPVQSRLEEARLEALAAAGGGLYRRADYRDTDTRDVLRAVARAADAGAVRDHSHRVWDERYPLPLAAMALLLALAWRRVRAVTAPDGDGR